MSNIHSKSHIIYSWRPLGFPCPEKYVLVSPQTPRKQKCQGQRCRFWPKKMGEAKTEPMPADFQTNYMLPKLFADTWRRLEHLHQKKLTLWCSLAHSHHPQLGSLVTVSQCVSGKVREQLSYISRLQMCNRRTVHIVTLTLTHAFIVDICVVLWTPLQSWTVPAEATDKKCIEF